MPHATVVPTDSGQVFVARQPVLDRGRQVFGYELLLRPAPVAEAASVAPDRAAATVISNVFIEIGLDTLVDGRKAFVKVGRSLLLEGIPEVLPPSRVIIELAGDIEADADVIAACRALREAGYQIAVDDFVLNSWTADLVPLATFLKVDYPSLTDAEARRKLAECGAQHHAKMVAKNVETLDLFEQAMKEGYAYFQGFFFGRPLILQGRSVPGHQVANLRLLHALHDLSLSVHQLEDLVKHDAALCYRILRTVNSAAYALRGPVHSIRDAMVYLGRDTVRRWASLWALAGMNERAHMELITMSTVRARCCELVGESMGGDEEGAEGFLVGLCSLMDVILERPMSSIVADVPLSDETRAALLGETNRRRRVLDCVIAYERGHWDRAIVMAQSMKVRPTLLPKAYADALKWSRELQAPPTDKPAKAG
jgi:EAL and modified HD-GYP domain-containing signal transduction protein